jgi:hypothetical protein
MKHLNFLQDLALGPQRKGYGRLCWERKLKDAAIGFGNLGKESGASCSFC